MEVYRINPVFTSHSCPGNIVSPCPLLVHVLIPICGYQKNITLPLGIHRSMENTNGRCEDIYIYIKLINPWYQLWLNSAVGKFILATQWQCFTKMWLHLPPAPHPLFSGLLPLPQETCSDLLECRADSFWANCSKLPSSCKDEEQGRVNSENISILNSRKQ